MNYRYCPYCKGELSKIKFEYACQKCHGKVYINPAPCVSVIPIKNNKILLARRGIDPKKGAIDFIGGFMNVGETVEEAAKREVLEETGLKIRLKDFLGDYPEYYVPGVTYLLTFNYTAEIVGGKLKAQDDVAELIWVDIKDIKKLDLTNSFKTVRKVLKLIK